MTSSFSVNLGLGIGDPMRGKKIALGISSSDLHKDSVIQGGPWKSRAPPIPMPCSLEQAVAPCFFLTDHLSGNVVLPLVQCSSLITCG